MTSRMLILVLGLLANILTAQVDFIHNKILTGNKVSRSTLSMAITDIDGNYKDDIIILDKGVQLTTACQNAPGHPFTIREHGTILENPAWALSVGDLNNDGISEIFTCGISTFGRVFNQNETGQYIYSQQLFNLSFPQNSNFADINNDGWLDLLVCDEVGYSDIFINNANGQLNYNDFIDFNTVVPSDNSGNYGSEWVDFDDDRDLDLFITKCKPVATSPEDPRRINVLFVNDGKNNYTERAEEYGLKNGNQSWTGTFGDIDNDGDLDCFVSNHDTPHILYKNNDGYFEDQTNSLITSEKSASYQAVIRDFDNNGYNDIYVSGSRDLIWWNMGNDHWQLEKNPFSPLSIFSFATGDLNDDGFLDVIASYGILNAPGKYDDRIWLNKKNDNHFLKISLKGEGSNSKGIGTKVKLFSDLGIKVQDARIGESYGTTNSSNLHFGMGKVEMIDSVHIYWPAGTVDKYYNVPVDAHFLAQEGICMKPFFNIIPEGEVVLCNDQAATLEIPLTLTDIQWSTGDSTQTISVSDDLQVSAYGIDSDGCLRMSNIKSVQYHPDQTPEVEFLDGSAVNCPGQRVSIGTTPAQAYHWSTGENTQTINITETGIYSVTIDGDCESFISAPLEIIFTDPQPVTLITDTITLTQPGEVSLSAEGSDVQWFSDDLAMNLLHTGPDFNTGWIEKDTVLYAGNRSAFFSLEKQIGMLSHQGTPYSGNNINSGLIFTTFKEILLEKVRVYTQHSGFRTIELKQTDTETGLAQTLASKRVYIDPQTSYIDLNFKVLPGKDYVLTTNADSNLVYQGMQSPRLYRSNTGANFPYILEDVMEITTTVHGPANYYYFYDWKIREKQAECLSELLPVYILFQTGTDIEKKDMHDGSVLIYPNPAAGSVNINRDEIDVQSVDFIEILELTGRRIKTLYLEKSDKINLSELSSGMYFLRIHTKGANQRVITKKIIVK